MNKLFSIYFNIFLNPFLYHEKKEALSKSKILEMDAETEELSLQEGISISWVFVIIGTLLESIFLYGFYNYLPTKYLNIFSGLGGGFAPLIYSLIQVILFPLFIYVKVKLWVWVIKFVYRLFRDAEVSEDKAFDIVIATLPCHVFLLIPFMGGMLRTVSFFIYLYAGLSRRLNFSFWQSMIVCLIPLLFFLLLIFLMGLLGILFLNDLRHVAF